MKTLKQSMVSLGGELGGMEGEMDELVEHSRM